MDIYTSAVLSAIIIALLFVIASYIWYHFSTWTQFSFKNRDLPEWATSTGASRLRFRNCKFNVSVGIDVPNNSSDLPAVESSLDVTNILNAMAKQSTSGITLKLARPLNPFSFTIVGFNDPKSMASASSNWASTRWCATNWPCTHGIDCDRMPDLCPSNGGCVHCYGVNNVTLTGEYRVV